MQCIYVSHIIIISNNNIIFSFKFCLSFYCQSVCVAHVCIHVHDTQPQSRTDQPQHLTHSLTTTLSWSWQSLFSHTPATFVLKKPKSHFKPSTNYTTSGTKCYTAHIPPACPVVLWVTVWAVLPMVTDLFDSHNNFFLCKFSLYFCLMPLSPKSWPMPAHQLEIEYHIYIYHIISNI